MIKSAITVSRIALKVNADAFVGFKADGAQQFIGGGHIRVFRVGQKFLQRSQRIFGFRFHQDTGGFVAELNKIGNGNSGGFKPVPDAMDRQLFSGSGCFHRYGNS